MTTFRTTCFALTVATLTAFAPAQSTERAYSIGNGNIRGRCWMNTSVTAGYGSTFDTRTYARIGSTESRISRVNGLFRGTLSPRNLVRGEFGGNIVYEYSTTTSGRVSGNHSVYNAFRSANTYTVDGMQIRVVTSFRGDGFWNLGVGLDPRWSRTEVDGYVTTGGRGHSAYATNLSLFGVSVGLESFLSLPTNQITLDLHTRSGSAWGTVNFWEASISMVQRIAKLWGWYTVVDSTRSHNSITRSL